MLHHTRLLENVQLASYTSNINCYMHKFIIDEGFLSLDRLLERRQIFAHLSRRCCLVFFFVHVSRVELNSSGRTRKGEQSVAKSKWGLRLCIHDGDATWRAIMYIFEKLSEHTQYNSKCWDETCVNVLKIIYIDYMTSIRVLLQAATISLCS